MYYFNNIIRITIANANYKDISNNDIASAVFAHELILDLSLLVHMLSRKSETDKMYRFIKSEKYPHFGLLFNDMIGDRIIYDYDSIERFRHLQIAYWLVNPYYESIYERTGDKTKLLELREDFLSEDFWGFVVFELERAIENNFVHS